MKKISIILIGLICTMSLFAQEKEEEEMQTLFPSKDFHSGFYGCPEVKVTTILDELSILVGGRGGWVINHSFSVGLGGYGLTTSPKASSDYSPPDDLDTNQYYLRAGWGGLFLQYTYAPNSLIHFTANSLIGAGGATYTPGMNGMGYNMGFGENDGYDVSAFFIFEPGIGVELNIFRFFRIELGGSYRIISGMDLKNTENSSIGGPSANLAFKFGNF